MKTLKFVPKVCSVQKVKSTGPDGVEVETEVQPTFEGAIEMNVPRNTERYQHLIDAGFVVDSNGEVNGVISSADKMRGMMKLIAVAGTYMTKVDLKKLSDGTEYKSYDELDYDPECEPIQNEVAGLMISGIRPSKN